MKPKTPLKNYWLPRNIIGFSSGPLGKAPVSQVEGAFSAEGCHRKPFFSSEFSSVLAPSIVLEDTHLRCLRKTMGFVGKVLFFEVVLLDNHPV